MHFNALSLASKDQVWTASISKMSDSAQSFTAEQIEDLARRQIKNAARTTHSLAVNRDEKVGFEHLRVTLDASFRKVARVEIILDFLFWHLLFRN